MSSGRTIAKGAVLTPIRGGRSHDLYAEGWLVQLHRNFLWRNTLISVIRKSVVQVVEFNHHALGHTPPFSTKCDRTYPSRRTLPYTHADALVFRVSTGE